MKYLSVVLTAALFMVLGQSATAETVFYGGDFQYTSGPGENLHTIEQIEFTVAVEGLVTIESTSFHTSYMRLFNASDIQIGSDFSAIDEVLVAGDYMVTIGLAGYTEANALDGFDAFAIPGRTSAWTMELTTPTAIPVPAALPLFFSAVTGLLLVRRRKQA